MYITQNDLTASAWPEIIAMLTNASEDIIAVNMNTALDTIKGYCIKRYDINEEFGKTGDARNNLLVLIARSLTIYYCYMPAETTPRKVEQAYERAIKMLEQIAQGLLALPGVNPPPAEPETTPQTTDIGYGHHPKRPSLV